MPMCQSIRTISTPELSEVEETEGATLQDASAWKFLLSRVHTDSDFSADVWRMEGVATVTSMMRKALDQARQLQMELRATPLRRTTSDRQCHGTI